jgi:hypothetical protein
MNLMRSEFSSRKAKDARKTAGANQYFIGQGELPV